VTPFVAIGRDPHFASDWKLMLGLQDRLLAGHQAPAPADRRTAESRAIVVGARWKGTRRRARAGQRPGRLPRESAGLANARESCGVARRGDPLRTGARSSHPGLTHPHRGPARRRRQRCCAAGRARHTRS
jgi:hypothetical protein